jgi:hypothetical protein
MLGMQRYREDVLTNIRGHRIRWRMQLASGAVVGAISAAVMLAIAMLLYPLFADASDLWSFPKVVSTVVYGQDAIQPLAGFDAGPVLVGLAIHFAIGIVAGMVYAGLIAMFDIEGWTPVALFGLLYGAMLFVWSTALVLAGLTPVDTGNLPVIVMFWGNVAFGLAAGLLLSTWADRADIDQADDEKVPVFEGQIDQYRLLH